MELEGNERFIIDLIREIGRPLEDYARNTITALASVDYFYFKNILESLGLEKAQKLYESVWFGEHLKNFRDLPMGLGKLKIEDISTLGKLARHYFDSRYCPLKPAEDNTDRFMGVILVCPYVTYSRDFFGERLGSNYHEVLGKSCDSFLSRLLKETEMESKAEGKMEKAICKGDDFCRVLFQRKGEK